MGFINWTELDSPQEFILLGTIIVGAVAGYTGYFWGRLRGTSIKIYKERLDALELETKACRDQHSDSLKAIHKLEGQVEVLKEIPLGTISKDLSEIKTSIKGLGERRNGKSK